MYRIVEDEDPPIPPGLPEDMDHFLKLCFQKEPRLRPSAVQLFEHPWLLKHCPELVSPPMTDPQPPSLTCSLFFAVRTRCHFSDGSVPMCPASIRVISFLNRDRLLARVPCHSPLPSTQSSTPTRPGNASATQARPSRASTTIKSYINW